MMMMIPCRTADPITIEYDHMLSFHVDFYTWSTWIFGIMHGQILFRFSKKKDREAGLFDFL